MAVYSIKDLEHLSGIKAHTLRVWEQRYNFINPKRTDTNIRYYDDHDLKLILNISLLKESGIKISHISEMTPDEIHQEVMQITETDLKYEDQIHALTLSMIDLDEERFERIISQNVLKLGFEKTIINVIYPFLSKIGILWQTGMINPAQEHFISNLVRQKLIVAIDGQFVPEDENLPKYLLYLPEGELHEVTLLFANYLLRTRKNRIVYLGQNVSFDDLRIAHKIHNPNNIFTVLNTKPESQDVESYLQKLSTTFPETHILVTGFRVIAQGIDTPENVKILNKIDDIIKFAER